MSREIKFRAWVNGFTPDQTGMFDVISYNYDRILTKNAKFKMEEEPYELMQYTGLKDKNGVEIYEGDIIQEDNLIYRVDFKTAMFEVIAIRRIGRGRRPGRSKPIAYTSTNNVVIGNIYENPELVGTSQ